AMVTPCDVAGRQGDHCVRAAHTGQVAPARLRRRVLPQMGGVGGVPTHVALVYRLDVVADRAVVAAQVPDPTPVRGEFGKLLGDLGTGQATVHQSYGLVVDVGVGVTLLG